MRRFVLRAGAMVSMSDGITIKTKMQGGLLQSMARTVFGGESSIKLQRRVVK